MILETTFLVDLEHELARGEGGPAQEFLAAHADDPLSITFTVAGELAAGMPREGRERWLHFIAPFETLTCTEAVCWEYGQAFRYLNANDLFIGTNDLWIAATALAYGKPVVTRNRKDFRRVPGIDVLRY